MEVRKILVIRTSALGDIVHVLPSLEALRELYPEAAIDWLVEPTGALLLAGHPLIRRLHVFDRGRWKKEWRRPSSWPALVGALRRLVGAVRRERYDLVVDFQCNVRSGLSVLLSAGRRRLGFARRDCPEWGGRLFTNFKAPPAPPGIPKVEKNLHLLGALGWKGGSPRPRIAVPPELAVWAGEILAGLPGRGPAIILHPAVSRFGEFKRWPAEGFRELIDRARAELDARILITWGPGEKEMAEAIGRPTVAPPISSPLQIAALAGAAEALVAADTGALHIASAVGAAVVGLYGPKDERIYGPWPPGPTTRALRSPAPCSPCRLRRCEHRICMSLIEAEEVFEALREVMGRLKA